MKNEKLPSIAIASDHAGFLQKEFLKMQLEKMGFSITDLGCEGPGSVNYPDFAAKVASEILAGRADRGILICGSGEGMVMAANRFAGIRAGLAWNTEIAALLRAHNNAQIICLGARFTANEYALQMVEVFLKTDFQEGNHTRRVEMLDQLVRSS